MKTLDVIGKSKIWLSVSGFLVVASIFCVAIFGLNWGIDFTGGTLLDVTFENEVTVAQIKDVLSGVGVDAVVQEGSESDLIRTVTLTQEKHDEILSVFEEQIGAFEENRFESIGPVIGEELKSKSVTAVVLLLILIVLYVAWAFRKVSEPIASWKYGILTIIAGLHDVIIPVGVFAVLGHYMGYEVSATFVAALLTILGYSINDTIVIFDRTR